MEPILLLLLLGAALASTEDSTLTADKKKLLVPNSELSLRCNTSFNYQDMTWSFNGEVITGDNKDGYELLPDKSGIVVKRAESKHAGNYTCSMNSSEFEGPAANLSRTIQVVQAPIAHINHKHATSINKVEGEELRINCLIWGHPRPSVTWSRRLLDDSVEFLQDNERADFMDHNNSTDLILRDVNMNDQGNYTCNVTNDEGSAIATVFVRVKSKLAALWPFLGICAEVAILCVIIFIYEKRRNKMELEESDTDQSPEQKKPSDRKEADVRHRK